VYAIMDGGIQQTTGWPNKGQKVRYDDAKSKGMTEEDMDGNNNAMEEWRWEDMSDEDMVILQNLGIQEGNQGEWETVTDKK
jgi:hypothetical protein